MNHEIDCQHWNEVTDMSEANTSAPVFKHLPCIFPMQYVTNDCRTIPAVTKRMTDVRRGFVKATDADKKMKARVEEEIQMIHDLQDEIKYADKPRPFLTETQKEVLEILYKQGANIHALAEQQASFYRDNGFEVYA